MTITPSDIRKYFLHTSFFFAFVDECLKNVCSSRLPLRLAVQQATCLMVVLDSFLFNALSDDDDDDDDPRSTRNHMKTTSENNCFAICYL